MVKVTPQSEAHYPEAEGLFFIPVGLFELEATFRFNVKASEVSPVREEEIVGRVCEECSEFPDRCKPIFYRPNILWVFPSNSTSLHVRGAGVATDRCRLKGGMIRQHEFK